MTLPAPPPVDHVSWRATILEVCKRALCVLHGHDWISQQYVDVAWHEYRRCRSCGRIER